MVDSAEAPAPRTPGAEAKSAGGGDCWESTNPMEAPMSAPMTMPAIVGHWQWLWHDQRLFLRRAGQFGDEPPAATASPRAEKRGTTSRSRATVSVKPYSAGPAIPQAMTSSRRVGEGWLSALP